MGIRNLLLCASLAAGCSLSSVKTDDPVAQKLLAGSEWVARTTIHEASHVVSAEAHPECAIVTKVRINRNGGRIDGGVNGIRTLLRNDVTYTESQVVACLAYYFAGQAGDRLFYGDDPLPNRRDREAAEKVARTLLGDRYRDALEKAKKLADEEVLKYRTVIGNIALALYESPDETLSLDEVVIIWLRYRVTGK